MTHDAKATLMTTLSRAHDDLDADCVALRDHATAWARLGYAGKIRHLRTMRARTIDVAERWVALAADAKGITGSPLTGEEWFSGPYGLLVAVDRLLASLGGLARNGVPRLPGTMRTRADGGVVVDVFPGETADRVLLSGVRAELWLEPGATTALDAQTARWYRESDPAGTVTLVLGAGNVASIAPLDVLSALYTHGSVALLKLNPVNDYLLPVLAHAFSSLIDEGFVRLARGGAEAGAYLCTHPAIDAIHLTGGERTHDAIVFGTGPEGAARKRSASPRVDKPVTSELGNVTPVIVVPGPWSEPDLTFQAAHVATMKLHNAGANCIAAQVLITPDAWETAPCFLERVRGALREAPGRPSYYPGSLERQHAISQTHPGAETIFPSGGGDPRTFITDLDATNTAEPFFMSEAFCPVLGQTSLPGADAATFLRNAVTFCNDVLRGTLGVSILIHPRTIAELGSVFDDAIAELRYGSVAINSWPGLGFLLPAASWGAYPGNTLAAVGSGIGTVHNACLFDHPQKTVLRAPFAPFPRSLGDGERTLLPTPPWFVTHRRGDVVARRMFAFVAHPSLPRMSATAFAAMRA